MKFIDLLEQFLFEGNKIDNILKRQGAKLIKAIKRDRTWNRLSHVVNTDVKIKAAYTKSLPTDPKEQLTLELFQAMHPKYVQWLANRYINREFKIEDIAQIKDQLRQFDKIKSKLPIKDINRYKTMPEFYNALASMEEVDTRSNKQKEREMKKQFFKDKDAEIYYKDSDITVIIPRTEAASCFFGRGTQWCTASQNHNMFDSYTRDGDLYIIIADDGTKMQFHFKSKQFMDEHDSPLNMGEVLEEYPSLLKAFDGDELIEGLPLTAIESHDLVDRDRMEELIRDRIPRGLEMEGKDTILLERYDGIDDFAWRNDFENTKDLTDVYNEPDELDERDFFENIDIDDIKNKIPKSLHKQISKDFRSRNLSLFDDGDSVKAILSQNEELAEAIVLTYKDVWKESIQEDILVYLEELVEDQEKLFDYDRYHSYGYLYHPMKQSNVVDSDLYMTLEIHEIIAALDIGDLDDDSLFDYVNSNVEEGMVENDNVREVESFKDSFDQKKFEGYLKRTLNDLAADDFE